MIDFNEVIDVCLLKETFIMNVGHGKPCKFASINIIKLPATRFNQQVFLYKKYLKAQIIPEERVAMFESEVNGIYCFDKYARVFNSRLRPDEEQERINEANIIIQDKTNELKQVE